MAAHASHTRSFLTALALAVLMLAHVAPAHAKAPVGADAQLSTASAKTLRSATLKLLNRERTSRGLVPLRVDRNLRRAALAHSRDMAQHDYFAHVSRNGVAPKTRILQSGWDAPALWTVGENLAWGTFAKSSPAGIVKAWMNSPEHRANILEAKYRWIGIGIAKGTPKAGIAGGATYTTDFGGPTA